MDNRRVRPRRAGVVAMAMVEDVGVETLSGECECSKNRESRCHEMMTKESWTFRPPGTDTTPTIGFH